MKIKSVVGTILLASALGLVVDGQVKRDKRIRPSKAQPRPTATPAPASSSLSIDAGLIYSNGDVKPVARTTFYILDQDMENDSTNSTWSK
jgi:hypothetical protein